MHRKKIVAGIVSISLLFVFVAVSVTASATPVSPNISILGPSGPAGSTGLTAKVIASPHEVIMGASIDATGYNIGIYVGTGVTGVKIIGDMITNATDHGIFVQDTSNIMIRGNTVMYTGTSPTPGIAENKAIELAGVSSSFVIGNTVKFNTADGGIGIADDGPFLDPGAPIATAAVPIASTNNLVMGNTVIDNAFGCGIVVASYNPGAGVSHNIVMNNVVLATGAVDYVPGTLPFVGGIVVAADVFNCTATDNLVLNNVINGSLIPGVVVHSNSEGDVVSGTIIIGNSISNNGLELESPDAPHMPAGIMVVSEIYPGQTVPPEITHTYVLSNIIWDNYYGVYVFGATGTHISNLQTMNVPVPVSIQ